MTLQNISGQTSDSALVRIANVFLSLFAIATLMSQSAMDLFSALFVLTALALAATRPDYRAWLFRRTGFEAAVALWFAATLLSLGLGAGLVPEPQWGKLLDFRWLLVAALAGRHLGYARVGERAILLHWAVFAAASLWAIAIFFLGYDPLDPARTLDLIGDGTVRTGGFLQQPIVFAQLYALWLMLAVGWLIQRPPDATAFRREPLVTAALVDALLWGSLAILLSFTRGVWLAIPVATLILLAIRRWTWALALSVAGAAALFVATRAWPALEGRILQAFQGGDSERLWIWSANWRMFLDHPVFGVGYNHNVQLLPAYYERLGAPEGLLVSHAHNQFLHILTGTGITGFIFYMGFWTLALLRALKLYRRARHAWFPAGLALGIFGAILCFLVGGFFESNFEHAKMRWVTALLVGLLLYGEDRETV